MTPSARAKIDGARQAWPERPEVARELVWSVYDPRFIFRAARQARAARLSMEVANE